MQVFHLDCLFLRGRGVTCCSMLTLDSSLAHHDLVERGHAIILVKGWTMHVFLLDCLLLMSLPRFPPSLFTPANPSLRSIQFQRSVSVVPRFPRSVSASLVSSFIALASIILRSRFRYPVVFISVLRLPAFSPRLAD